MKFRSEVTRACGLRRLGLYGDHCELDDERRLLQSPLSFGNAGQILAVSIS
jgi:hypothetical protein